MRVQTAPKYEGRKGSLPVRLHFTLTPHFDPPAFSFRTLATIEDKKYIALYMREFHLRVRDCSGSSGSLGFEFRRLLDLGARHSDRETVRVEHNLPPPFRVLPISTLRFLVSTFSAMGTATSRQKEVVQQPEISPVYLDLLQICHDTGMCRRPLLYGVGIEMGEVREVGKAVRMATLL